MDDPALFDGLTAPVLLRYRPGRISLTVDARESAPEPELWRELATAATDLLKFFDLHETPAPTSPLVCAVERVRYLPGGRWATAEWTPGLVYVEVRRRGVSEVLAGALAVLGTSVGRYFTVR